MRLHDIINRGNVPPHRPLRNIGTVHERTNILLQLLLLCLDLLINTGGTLLFFGFFLSNPQPLGKKIKAVFNLEYFFLSSKTYFK